jgi:hypothetical protein
MVQTTLEKGFRLMLSTNCRLFSKKEFFNKFINITDEYKNSIIVITARDRFHLKYFDPLNIVNRLRKKSFNVIVNDYANQTILLSKYNIKNEKLLRMNTDFSCCNGIWNDYLGVLPEGEWTICPASLEIFGNVFINPLEEVVEFKRGLSLKNNKGCTECLKDFKYFSNEFNRKYTKQLH